MEHLVYIDPKVHSDTNVNKHEYNTERVGSGNFSLMTNASHFVGCCTSYFD